MKYGYKTQNLMLISNPLKMLQKTHAKSYQRKGDRKMDFLEFLAFWVNCLHFFQRIRS
jgi:hypothetical protein